MEEEARMVRESKWKSEVEEEAMMVSLVNVKVFALQNAGVNYMQESGEWAVRGVSRELYCCRGLLRLVETA